MLSRPAVLATLGGMVYAALLVLGLTALMTTPHFSLDVAVPRVGTARITWLLPGSSLWDRGVRPHDQVLALNGKAPVPDQTGAWSGGRVILRTAAHTVLITSARILQRSHSAWPLVLLSPWFLILGTLIYLRARQPNVGRSAYLLFGSAACAFALTPATDSDQPIASVGEFALVLLFAAAFVRFFLTFPQPRGRRYARTAVLILPLALMPTGVAALIWPVLYDPASLLRLVLLLLALCYGTGLLIQALRTQQEGTTRAGLAIIGVGTLVAVLPFVALYLLPTVFSRQQVLPPEIAVLPLGIMPVSFAYAILRRNTLQIPLLQRWFVHGMLWTVLIAAYAAPAYILHGLIRAVLLEPARSLVFTASLVALIAVSFRWLHDVLWDRIDRRIFKDRYDYRASLHALSRDISHADDLAVLSTSLSDTLRRLMNLEFDVLLIQEQRGPSVQGIAGACQPALLPALVSAASAVQGEPEVVSLAYGYLKVLLAPLRTRDLVLGHLCLGPKLSGEPFLAADKALLATLGGHLAAMVGNVQLLDDLRDKVTALDALNERLQRVQEEERAYLVADIHDEPLQTAIHLHRQIVDAAGTDPTARVHATLSRTVVDQLRALCSAIRPPTLDDLGLPAALDRLALDLGGRQGVPILLDVEPELADISLPRALDLVLYRAAQEALNNCLRHAHPTLIRVALRREGDLLRLSVVDDGTGFDVPPQLDELITVGHLGLAGLRTRVQRAGGSLLVTSTPATGTELLVDLPMKVVS